jgi:crotonobetainyl-CoA:carnitine CoA-transferase CaiB-like acyl-CoA transferase
MPGPLQGVRVVELGHALAAPFASALLADFGADVIKVEHPQHGDSLREMGPALDESSAWWAVTGRNKRSVSVDFKDPEGLKIVRDLIASADVMVENFRPGVLDRAGLGWEELHAAYPSLVVLSISGYGRGGPYSDRPGFGKIAEAMSGATHLTGHADQPPVHPGYSLGDATSGMTGALGVLLALRHRDATGEGQLVDVALYEPLLRMVEWQVPLHSMGLPQSRKGAGFPFEDAFLTDVCATSDESNIVVSAATTKAKEAIRTMLVGEGLLDANVVPTVKEMAAALRGWVAQRPRAEALEVLRGHDIVVGPVYSAEDIVADPHMAARGNLVTMPTNHGVELPMPGVVPQLSATPGEVRWVGPLHGQHTGEVLTEVLGLDPAYVEKLAASGVVAGPGGVG